MTSRFPNEENDESLRPLLGWDQAMAALQRNILQQNQHHQTSLNQAAAAALAAGIPPSTSIANTGISPMWPYNLPGAASMLQPAAAAAAASLALLSNPTNSYLNHLQNMHNPESLLSFQQNITMLEQLQQQRQLLAANPHLLMALQALQTTNAPISPQTHNPTQHQQHQHQHQQQVHQHNPINHNNLPIPINDLSSHRNDNSPKSNNTNNSSINQGITNCTGSTNSSSSNSSASSSSGSVNGASNLTNHNSLLTTVNSSLAGLTNQHQDSLVDQHFRRSLGEDYNQIMSNKADKINVAK